MNGYVRCCCHHPPIALTVGGAVEVPKYIIYSHSLALAEYRFRGCVFNNGMNDNDYYSKQRIYSNNLILRYVIMRGCSEGVYACMHVYCIYDNDIIYM